MLAAHATYRLRRLASPFGQGIIILTLTRNKKCRKNITKKTLKIRGSCKNLKPNPKTNSKPNKKRPTEATNCFTALALVPEVFSLLEARTSGYHRRYWSDVNLPLWSSYLECCNLSSFGPGGNSHGFTMYQSYTGKVREQAHTNKNLFHFFFLLSCSW